MDEVRNEVGCGGKGVRGEVMRDEVVRNEVVRGKVVRDEVARNEVLRGKVLTCEVLTCEVLTCEVPPSTKTVNAFRATERGGVMANRLRPARVKNIPFINGWFGC